jgi:hypothetical protein
MNKSGVSTVVTASVVLSFGLDVEIIGRLRTHSAFVDSNQYILILLHNFCVPTGLESNKNYRPNIFDF